MEHMNWEEVYIRPHKYKMSTQICEFQYRCIHDILVNNYWLYKWNLSESNLCRLCGSHIETIYHIFWECQFSQHFWDTLNCHFNGKLRNEININDVFFGNNDNLTCTIIFNAKRYIYVSFNKEEVPTLQTCFENPTWLIYTECKKG